MSAPDLGELRRLLEAATPGPWDVVQSSRALGYFDVVAGATNDGSVAPMVVPSDAELITAAVNALPALLDDLEAAREEIAALIHQRDSAERRHERLEAGVEALANALDDEHYDAMGGGSKYCREGSCATCEGITRMNALLAETTASEERA